jgi:hypothetical protein
MGTGNNNVATVIGRHSDAGAGTGPTRGSTGYGDNLRARTFGNHGSNTNPTH